MYEWNFYFCQCFVICATIHIPYPALWFRLEESCFKNSVIHCNDPVESCAKITLLANKIEQV